MWLIITLFWLIDAFFTSNKISRRFKTWPLSTSKLVRLFSRSCRTSQSGPFHAKFRRFNYSLSQKCWDTTFSLSSQCWSKRFAKLPATNEIGRERRRARTEKIAFEWKCPNYFSRNLLYTEWGWENPWVKGCGLSGGLQNILFESGYRRQFVRVKNKERMIYYYKLAGQFFS